MSEDFLEKTDLDNLDSINFEPDEPKSPIYKRTWFIVTTVFVLLFLGWVIISVALAYFNAKRGNFQVSELNNFTSAVGLPASQGQVDVTSLYTSDDPSLGTPTASIQIVEFADFQCPFCAQAHSIMRQLADKYSDKIYYIYRDFPIDEIHPQARLAAEAGECAQEQGKFWPWHDKVFQNQGNMRLNNLLDYAREVGVDMDAFGSCLQSGRFRNEVEQDLQDGIKAGVKATPTFFVNGEKIEGVIPLDAWEQAINAYN